MIGVEKEKHQQNEHREKRVKGAQPGLGVVHQIHGKQKRRQKACPHFIPQF